MHDMWALTRRIFSLPNCVAHEIAADDSLHRDRDVDIVNKTQPTLDFFKIKN
jgi:hypothetical protein